MKKYIFILLLFIVLMGLGGCTKPKTPENPTTEATHPKIEETETKPNENSAEFCDPYEEYISTVGKGKYHYADLNGDSKQELIILRNNSKSEILTISDDYEPLIIFSGHHIFLCENNIVGQFSEGSGGCTLFFYKIEGNDAAIIDTIVYNYHESAFYLGTDSQNMRQISEEDAFKISKQYALLDESIPWYLTWFYSK